MRRKIVIAMGLAILAGVLGVSNNASAANPRSTFTVPADCQVFQDRDWSSPGADPVVRNVNTVGKLVAMLRSPNGRRAMHCAGFTPAEQVAIIAAARNAVPCVIEKGSPFAIMVGGHAVLTNGRLTASSLACWVIKTRTKKGVELELEVAVVCGNLLPRKRVAPLASKLARKGKKLVQVVRTPQGDIIIEINITNTVTQRQGGQKQEQTQRGVPVAPAPKSKPVSPSPTRVGVDATLQCPSGGLGTLRVVRTLAGNRAVSLPIVCGQTLRVVTVIEGRQVGLCLVGIPARVQFGTGSSPKCVRVRAGLDVGPRWILFPAAAAVVPASVNVFLHLICPVGTPVGVVVNGRPVQTFVCSTPGFVGTFPPGTALTFCLQSPLGSIFTSTGGPCVTAIVDGTTINLAVQLGQGQPGPAGQSGPAGPAGPAGPSLSPVDAVVGPWTAWTPSTDWSACVAGSQTRTEQRTRVLLVPSQNGGATLALVETRTVSQGCGGPADPLP